MKHLFFFQNEESSKTQNVLRIILLLIVVGGVTSGLTLATVHSNPELIGLSKDQIIQNNEAQSLITDVQALIELPIDEQPTIATVDDAEKVRSQEFFKNAQNGDRVLIYTQAKKAYLYRPSENKLIDVGTVRDSEENLQIDQTALPEPSVDSTSSATPSQ